LIKKNYAQLKNKKIIVVAVGATLKKEIAIAEVKGSNFTPEMQNRVPLYLLRGGFNYKKMNLLDKTLMYLLVKSLKFKKKEELDDDSKGMIATYGRVVDFTNRKAIVPIINAIMDPQKT